MSSNLTPEARARLGELASKATPGPWESTWSTDSDSPDTEDETVILAPNQDNEARVVVGLIWYNGTHVACTEPNAAHIAAADPATVITLLDALDGAESLLAYIASVVPPTSAIGTLIRHRGVNPEDLKVMTLLNQKLKSPT